LQILSHNIVMLTILRNKAGDRAGSRPAKLKGEQLETACERLAAGKSVSSVVRAMGVLRATVPWSVEVA
jgi:hypothetical protein